MHNMTLSKVRDLEERLVEKEHELKQMRRNLDESEGAIAQVNLSSGSRIGIVHLGGGLRLTFSLRVGV